MRAVRILTTRHEIEAIREWWQSEVADPNAELDHYFCVIDSRDWVLGPLVVAVFDHGTPVAAVAGRLEHLRYRTRIGYVTVRGPRGVALEVVQGGVLGTADGRVSRTIVRALRTLLRRGVADLVRLPYLLPDSGLLEHARSGGLLTDRYPESILRWSVDTTSPYDTYLSSLGRSTRKHLRNYRNRLRREFDGNLRTVRVTGFADLVEHLPRMESIARRSYQRALGVGFGDHTEMRTRLRLAADRNMMTAYLLYGADALLAFDIQFRFGGTCYLDSGAFDADYGHLHPGTVLLHEEIADACSSSEFRALDFGFGDAVYKQIYGTGRVELTSMRLFATRGAGPSTWLVHSLSGALRRSAARALRALGAVAAVKRGWRRFARKTTVAGYK